MYVIEINIHNRHKYYKVNIIKYMQELHIEDKMFLKDKKKYLNVRNNTSYSWTRRYYNTKISFIPKLIYKVKKITKIFNVFVKLILVILKFMYNFKKAKSVQENFLKEKGRRTCLKHFRTLSNRSKEDKILK